MQVHNGHDALFDFRVQHELVEWRAAAVQAAAARERPPLKLPQHLFHIDAVERPVAGVEAGRSGESAGQSPDGSARSADVDLQRAAALKLVHAEDLAEARGKI